MDKWEKTIEYMDYLEDTYGYKLTIKDFAGFMTQDTDTFRALNRYYRHRLPFCDALKKSPKLYDACYNNTLRMEKYLRAKVRAPYIASCYCGIFDLVYPIYNKDSLIAAICLSGFNHDYAKTIKKFDANFSAESKHDKLLTLLNTSINLFDADSINWSDVLIHIGIIAEHIQMIYLLLIEKKIINEGSVYARTESHLWTFSSVLDYIQQHYTDPITLTQVCEHIQCSKSYVSHAFKQFTGTTFKKYLNNLRITKAQEMLKKNASINETALSCGFVDPNYFSVVFKEITNMTPTDFKKKNCP